jgi:16S rRNA C967 or C1407 C5-methylase (RsmB/RsmF family)
VKGPPKPAGAAAFRDRYGGIYGPRWPALEAALAGPPDYLEISFCEGGGFIVRPGGANDIAQRAPAESPPRYFLDSASLFAASCLSFPEGGGRVLDACAAPGGKSLVLAARMGGSRRLVANELSADRRRRLAAVLDSTLPASIRSRVEVWGRDAAAMCRSMPEFFEAVLLDAPCSSERHVLADSVALAAWRPARVRNLAARQWALLSSAFLMLKPGGCLVYATCSMAPEENDGVAARLEAKYGGALRWEPPGPGDIPPEFDEELRSRLAGALEETRYGMIILPDRASGAGPMYLCRAWKRAAS